MAAAERVMVHPEFVRVRNAIRRRLQFTNRMGHGEIGKVARVAAGRPVVA